MLNWLITHAIAVLVGGGVGWYGHYKFGSKLAAIEAKVKSVV